MILIVTIICKFLTNVDKKVLKAHHSQISLNPGNIVPTVVEAVYQHP